MIDAHVHVWTRDELRYPFGPHDGLAVPTDSNTIDDILGESAEASVDGLVLIQPRIYGYDHAYLFDAARRAGNRTRVVPLVNILRECSVSELRRLAADARTSAFRVIALGHEPAEWLLSPPARSLWTAASQLDLPVGLLIDAPQLPLVAQLADHYPQLTIIVDHMARCAPDLHEKWGPALRSLADYPNVFVKLSAIDALSRCAFPHADMWQLVEGLYGSYGASRLLWGSDWPHVKGHGRYEDSFGAIACALDGIPEADKKAIFGKTAERIFAFPHSDGEGGVT